MIASLLLCFVVGLAGDSVVAAARPAYPPLIRLLESWQPTPDRVRALIDKGADVNATDSDGRSAVMAVTTVRTKPVMRPSSMPIQ